MSPTVTPDQHRYLFLLVYVQLQGSSEACTATVEYQAWHGSTGQCVGSRRWPEAGHVSHQQGESVTLFDFILC